MKSISACSIIKLTAPGPASVHPRHIILSTPPRKISIADIMCKIGNILKRMLTKCIIKRHANQAMGATSLDKKP